MDALKGILRPRIDWGRTFRDLGIRLDLDEVHRAKYEFELLPVV